MGGKWNREKQNGTQKSPEFFALFFSSQLLGSLLFFLPQLFFSPLGVAPRPLRGSLVVALSVREELLRDGADERVLCKEEDRDLKIFFEFLSGVSLLLFRRSSLSLSPRQPFTNTQNRESEKKEKKKKKLPKLTGVGVGQQRADRQQHLAHCQGRGPLVLEDVEADLPVAVDVAVVDAGLERDLGRLERVVRRKVDVEEEDAAGVGRARGAEDRRDPLEDVVTLGARRAVAGRVERDLGELLLDALGGRGHGDVFFLRFLV